MRKILSLLRAMILTTTTSTSIIACGGSTNQSNQKNNLSTIITNTDLGNVYVGENGNWQDYDRRKLAVKYILSSKYPNLDTKAILFGNIFKNGKYENIIIFGDGFKYTGSVKISFIESNEKIDFDFNKFKENFIQQIPTSNKNGALIVTAIRSAIVLTSENRYTSIYEVLEDDTLLWSAWINGKELLLNSDNLKGNIEIRIQINLDNFYFNELNWKSITITI